VKSSPVDYVLNLCWKKLVLESVLNWASMKGDRADECGWKVLEHPFLKYLVVPGMDLLDGTSFSTLAIAICFNGAYLGVN